MTLHRLQSACSIAGKTPSMLVHQPTLQTCAHSHAWECNRHSMAFLMLSKVTALPVYATPPWAVGIHTLGCSLRIGDR